MMVVTIKLLIYIELLIIKLNINHNLYIKLGEAIYINIVSFMFQNLVSILFSNVLKILSMPSISRGKI